MKPTNYSDIRKLDGWLARTDFELLRALLGAQDERGIGGSIVEIGVHHGKSFIPLAGFAKKSQLYAIDIFGNQELNLDRSGSGDLEEFRKNLKSFRIDLSRVEIDCRLSSRVDANEIIEKVGKARLFHIDGGHHLAAIQSDLELACAVLLDEGVIAIDDVFRADWPEVTVGVFQSEALRRDNYVMFASGFNKTFFCKADYKNMYQKFLASDPIMISFLTRVYKTSNNELQVFKNYPHAEWSIRQFVSYLLEVKLPDTFIKLKPKNSKM